MPVQIQRDVLTVVDFQCMRNGNVVRQRHGYGLAGFRVVKRAPERLFIRDARAASFPCNRVRAVLFQPFHDVLAIIIPVFQIQIVFEIRLRIKRRCECPCQRVYVAAAGRAVSQLENHLSVFRSRLSFTDNGINAERRIERALDNTALILFRRIGGDGQRHKTALIGVERQIHGYAFAFFPADGNQRNVSIVVLDTHTADQVQCVIGFAIAVRVKAPIDLYAADETAFIFLDAGDNARHADLRDSTCERHAAGSAAPVILNPAA